jgi:hypothetical protein
MFTVLRGVLVIGVIFYLSPARHPRSDGSSGSGTGTVADEIRKGMSIAEGKVADGKAADGAWKRLAVAVTEEAVRSAVQEKAHAAGLRLKDNAQWSVLDSTQKAPAKDGARQDPDPKAPPGQSVRCVYHCDSTE